jgi:hypothetical protein
MVRQLEIAAEDRKEGNPWNIPVKLAVRWRKIQAICVILAEIRQHAHSVV